MLDAYLSALVSTDAILCIKVFPLFLHVFMCVLWAIVVITSLPNTHTNHAQCCCAPEKEEQINMRLVIIVVCMYYVQSTYKQGGVE